MSRRLQILSIDPGWIVEWWNEVNRVKREGDTTTIVFPTRSGLPADAKVVSVQTDWFTRRINVMLSHDSFAEVADGEIPPIVQANEVRAVEINAKEQGNVRMH